jgi:hypothetical protein
MSDAGRRANRRVTVTRPRRAGGADLRRGMRLALRWPSEEVRLLPPEA